VAIVREARRILEADGLEHLTMQRVAKAVGVRAPSLYKHVGGRDELIRLVAVDATEELGHRLAATTTGDARRDIGSMAHVLRAFAHELPETYRLLWSPVPAAWRPHPDVSAHAVEPMLEVVAHLARGTHTLEAARTLTAWAHGFVSMELAGAFRLGGDVDEAFDYGIERLAGAIAGPGRR
jgi:AcrR family transcriptional regulator